MLEQVTNNLAKLRFSEHQEFFWEDATEFFKWCQWRLCHCVEKLNSAARKEFELGKVPKGMLDEIRADLSSGTQFNGGRHGRDEFHCAVSANVGDKEIVDYIRVCQSREMALTILVALACGEVTIDELDKKSNEAGKVRLGKLRLSEKRFVIRSVESSGNLRERGIASVIYQLARNDDGQFFIELGKALKKAGKPQQRRPEVEWAGVNTVASFLVDNWCYWSAGGAFPPLCLFDNKTLATFCAIALGNKQSDKDTSITAIRKQVSRLRLKRPSAPRIRQIDQRLDWLQFRR